MAGDTFQAGSAMVDLDPPLGLPIMGRCRLGGIMSGLMNATGHFTPLCARAVAFADGRQVLVICSVDVMAMKWDLTQRVRQLVQQSLQREVDIVVVATHTHSAPPGYKEFGFTDDRADRWLNQLESKIAQAACEAVGGLQPAQLRLGEAQVHDIASNRRIRMPDGRLDMNFLVPDPSVGTPAGPFDPQLLLLVVESLDGQPIALVANFACHGNMLLEREHLDYCAEPFVMAMLGMEKQTPGIVGLHLPGAMGDISAYTLHRERSHRGEGRMAGFYARHLNNARAAARLIEASPIVVRNAEFDAARRPLPGADDVRSDIRDLTAVLDDAQRRADHEATWKAMRLISHREALLDHIEHHATRQPIPLRYRIIRVGDLAIVTCPGELFAEYGLALKAAATPRPCMVVGYADDYHGYFPALRAFEEGGYETMPSIYSLAEAAAGHRYVEQATHQLTQMCKE